MEKLVEEKRRRREEKLKRRRKEAQLRTALLLVFLALVAIAIIALFRSDIFKIEQKKVTIEGVKYLKKAKVLKLLNIPKDASIFSISTRSMEKKLEEEAWVKRAQVSRDFPNGLRVVIEERQPIALLVFPNQTYYMIDSEAVILAPAKEEKLPNLPLIHDIKVKLPGVGVKVDSNELKAVLEILEAMPTSLYQVVKIVSAPNLDKLTFYTDSGVEILFGGPQDMEKKFRVLEELMKQDKQLIFVDVRVPENPVSKALD
jgi:cell division protein FtsQ